MEDDGYPTVQNPYSTKPLKEVSDWFLKVALLLQTLKLYSSILEQTVQSIYNHFILLFLHNRNGEQKFQRAHGLRQV